MIRLKIEKRGGEIVFGTIIENVKSFFQREEDLTARPKRIPEAASEIYSKPQQKIVEKQLPQQLPFSPDELRKALKIEQPPPAQPKPAERDITHEIVAFEQSLQEAHTAVEPLRSAAPQPARIAVTQSAAQAPISSADAPFFNEFEQFITREDLAADGILEQDILYRMKEFHRHKQEGKEYYLYSKDVQQAVGRKLGELKSLEREWFEKREQADRLEKDMAMIERDIESHTQELKGLLRQARAKSRLEQKVSPGQEFILTDGRKLTSLLELKLALKTMPETVFSHHVTNIKNDFAAWVRGAMSDPALADEMGIIRDKQQLEIFLSKIGQ